MTAPSPSIAPPRVLVLSDEGPQTGTAGGLLLHRLFQHHPPERLRVLARHVPTIGEPLPNVGYRRLIIPWHRFESSRFHRLKRSLRAFGLVPKLSLQVVERLLNDFRPEVVFCVMQHAQYYDTARHYAQSRRLPLIVAVHDINDDFEPVYAWARSATRRRDGEFYRAAARRLCISSEMERWCAQTYGASGDVLPPNRSEELQPRPTEWSGTLRQPGHLTLGFAGNLNYGYGQAFCQLLPAIRNAGVRLVFYGRAPGPECAALADALDCCEFRGFVTPEAAWAGLQRDCDAVWLPYPNPAGSMERLYRHHFPSKLPEYLALGMPVIVSGPDYATGIRWARENADAVARATGADLGEMNALFQRLRDDSAWRIHLAKRALDVGQRDFDPSVIRAKFYDHLCAAARGGEPANART